MSKQTHSWNENGSNDPHKSDEMTFLSYVCAVFRNYGYVCEASIRIQDFKSRLVSFDNSSNIPRWYSYMDEATVLE